MQEGGTRVDADGTRGQHHPLGAARESVPPWGSSAFRRFGCPSTVREKVMAESGAHRWAGPRQSSGRSGSFRHSERVPCDCCFPKRLQLRSVRASVPGPSSSDQVCKSH